MFTGCGTAMVTPFTASGALDENTLRKLVRRQIEQGIDFLVPCGTTGESPTLTMADHIRTVAITVEESAGKVPVLAGAGGYFTKEVIELAQECRSAGADGILSVTPYYNKPSQEGLYQHYKALAESVDCPIVLYSVKGRTGVNIDPATVVRLAGIPNIVGVKEASGDIGQMAEIVSSVPEDFFVLCGDDGISLALIGLGGHGLISVAANEIPREMTELIRLALAGDFSTARLIQKKYLPLMSINFVESNPIPVKWAMSRMGLLEANYRLPLVPPSDESQKKIEKVLHALHLTKDGVTFAGRN